MFSNLGKDASMTAISSFEKNGWGCYARPKEMEHKFISQEIVENGREMLCLNPKIKYSLLPLITQDDDYLIVRDFLKVMSMHASYFELTQGNLRRIEKGEYAGNFTFHPIDYIIRENEGIRLVANNYLYSRYFLKKNNQSDVFSVFFNQNIIEDSIKNFVNVYEIRNQTIQRESIMFGKELENMQNRSIC